MRHFNYCVATVPPAGELNWDAAYELLDDMDVEQLLAVAASGVLSDSATTPGAARRELLVALDEFRAAADQLIDTPSGEHDELAIITVAGSLALLTVSANASSWMFRHMRALREAELLATAGFTELTSDD